MRLVTAAHARDSALRDVVLTLPWAVNFDHLDFESSLFRAVDVRQALPVFRESVGNSDVTSLVVKHRRPNNCKAPVMVHGEKTRVEFEFTVDHEKVIGGKAAVWITDLARKSGFSGARETGDEV